MALRREVLSIPIELPSLGLKAGADYLTWEFWNGDKWAPLLPPTEDLGLLRQIASLGMED